MRKSRLLVEMQDVAMEEMKTSRVGLPPNMRNSEKFHWLEKAYGLATVVDDFREWCRENKSRRPKYPVMEYVKVADDRLSENGEEKPILVLDDPRVKTISAAIYDLSGFTPTRKAVAELLTEYTEKEILDAAKEYVETLEEKDFKKGMKNFFLDGGCAVVIYAQKHRGEKK